ncbi:MAG: hypothetical protein JO290_02850 [Sphingomonadaceae bacterium]|nr:hypothetical protein [Sphingomonadaceae bacterium]
MRYWEITPLRFYQVAGGWRPWLNTGVRPTASRPERAPDLDHRWRVRATLPERFGHACRVTARGAMNSVEVEFADGERHIVSRYAVRRLRQSAAVAPHPTRLPRLAGLAEVDADDPAARLADGDVTRVGVQLEDVQQSPVDDGRYTQAMQLANLEAIREASMIARWHVAAFGPGIARRYPELVDEAMFAFRWGVTQILSLRLSDDGWPLHPLARGKHAIPNGTKPIEWRA